MAPVPPPSKCRKQMDHACKQSRKQEASFGALVRRAGVPAQGKGPRRATRRPSGADGIIDDNITDPRTCKPTSVCPGGGATTPVLDTVGPGGARLLAIGWVLNIPS